MNPHPPHTPPGAPPPDVDPQAAAQDRDTPPTPTDNVDAAEVDKFTRATAQWWDPEGEFKPLHAINPLRIGFIQGHSPPAGRTVLDVGCGGGLLSEALALRGAEVTGIDAAAAPLTAARAHAEANGVRVEYRQSTAEALALEGRRWDIVCCLELLEHVPDPRSVVRACAALVKDGGAVYFSTINRTAKAYAMAILGAEYVLGLLPRGTHHYEKFIRPGELDEWCRAAGITLTDITGLHYQPFTQRYFLAPGVGVNYLTYAVAG